MLLPHGAEPHGLLTTGLEPQALHGIITGAGAAAQPHGAGVAQGAGDAHETGAAQAGLHLVFLTLQHRLWLASAVPLASVTARRATIENAI